jgi:RelB Antitoxin alpha helical domain
VRTIFWEAIAPRYPDLYPDLRLFQKVADLNQALNRLQLMIDDRDLLSKSVKMLELHKRYVVDENQQLVAVQIPIAEFEKIEELLENFGLAKLIDEVEDRERLSKDEVNSWRSSLHPNTPGDQPEGDQPIEADLLQQINIGLSGQDWQQYHALITKRRAETLTPDEHERLIQMSEQLETLNVARIQALIQLATLRNQPLTTLMQNLGITPNPDIVEMQLKW